MTTTLSKRHWALPLIAAFALSAGAADARAQATSSVETSSTSGTVATPTNSTPGMIGGQVVGAGRIVLGAATGYPETQLRAFFGISRNIDIGVFAGFTYGMNTLRSGLWQGAGLDLQVPLRFTIVHSSRMAMALRLVPFFRIGQQNPAYSAGGILGARFSIALPKIFSLILGVEQRLGFASVGDQAFCLFGLCTPNRVNFFEGASYGVLGLESILHGKWFLNLELDGGEFYGTNQAGHAGLINAWVGFGKMLR